MIYLYAAGHKTKNGKITGPLKIGHTGREDKRCGELNVARLAPLEMLFTYKIPKGVIPEYLERGFIELLYHLTKVRKRGENISLDSKGEMLRIIKHINRTGKLRQSDEKWLKRNGYLQKSRDIGLHHRYRRMNQKNRLV